MSYILTPVGMYKRAPRGGFYYYRSMPLEKMLKQDTITKSVNAYRESITEANPKGDKLLKSSILAYSPSGDYGKNPRTKDGKLLHKTGLVHLDFDSIPKAGAVAKKLFAKYNWIAVAQRSCSGNGFYILVNTLGPEDYECYWAALVKFFRETEKLAVDSAVSSVNEIRFCSLPGELYIRDNAKQWKEKIEKEESQYEGDRVPYNGKVLYGDKANLRYVDLISIAGKNNINGAPLADLMKGITLQNMDPKSSVKTQKEIDAILVRIYDRYADQHGVAFVPVFDQGEQVDLPVLQFDKKESHLEMALKIVRNVAVTYLLKTDRLTNQTYKYNGVYWEEVQKHELRNFLSAAAYASGCPGNLAQRVDFRDKLEAQIVDETQGNLSSPKGVFNLLNCVITFNQTTGEIEKQDHGADFNFSYVLDYCYDPMEVNRPAFNQFIDWAIPDKDTQRMFWQYIGSAFLPEEVSFEQTLYLLGSGANGKTVLTNVIADLFGDAVGYFSMERLTDSQGDAAAKHAYGIYRKLFGLSPESGKVKDFELWRTLVSKQPITMKRLYKDSFITTDYGRLISCTNDMGYMDSHLYGTERRLRIIEMKSVRAPGDQDRMLRGKLKEERSALLNLVIQGFKEIVASKGRLLASAQSLKSTQDVIQSFDNVLQFILDKGYIPLEDTDSGKTKGISAMDKYKKMYPGQQIQMVKTEMLYEDFRLWCHDEGVKPLSNSKFTKRLISLEPEKFKGPVPWSQKVIKINDIPQRVWRYRVHQLQLS